MTDAFQFLYNIGGLETASDYGEYKNKEGQCKFDEKKVKARITDWY